MEKTIISLILDVIVTNDDADPRGYGAIMSVNVKDGKIEKIFAETPQDRGYDYRLVPTLSVLGTKIFIAEIVEFTIMVGLKRLMYLKVYLGLILLIPKLS